MFKTKIRLITLLMAVSVSMPLWAKPHHHAKKAVSHTHHQQGSRTLSARTSFHYDAFDVNSSLLNASYDTKASKRYFHLQDGTGLAETDALHETREKILARLKAQLGKPYVWGGESPREGFDCSGLVFYAYNAHLSASLPRTANAMYHDRRGNPVTASELKPGDLVFFHIHHGKKADHVGVYLGDGQFIQAPRTGETIRISSLNDPFWQDHWLGARRVITPRTVA
ncbi:C40 family peptidase [Franconibacter pulveris 601]|uniref:C40 family peptidase n=1 Tax=Franconibacter pulveris TaxID=435910 RepID=UPI00046737EF